MDKRRHVQVVSGRGECVCEDLGVPSMSRLIRRSDLREDVDNI